MSKPIVTTSITDIDTFYIFRPDGTEVKVEAIREDLNGNRLNIPFLKCNHMMTPNELNEIYKILKHETTTIYQETN